MIMTTRKLQALVSIPFIVLAILLWTIKGDNFLNEPGSSVAKTQVDDFNAAFDQLLAGESVNSNQLQILFIEPQTIAWRAEQWCNRHHITDQVLREAKVSEIVHAINSGKTIKLLKPITIPAEAPATTK